MMRAGAWYSLLVLTAATAGCRHSAPSVNPYVQGRPPEYRLPAQDSAQGGSSVDLAARLQRLQPAETAATRSSPMALTVESSDGPLKAALSALALAPSAETHRMVAGAYLRVGVRDAAMKHYTRAIALAPRDAASYEMRARIWRLWGFPELGLADGHRARCYAPASPSAHNTLGTLFQAIGRYAQARENYEIALHLDPTADYARRNLAAVTAAERAMRAPETRDAR